MSKILDQWEAEAKESDSINMSESRIYYRDHRILALIELVRKYEVAVQAKDEALKLAENLFQIDRDDFEKLRVQEFKTFNVHEFDTGSVEMREALALTEELKP